MKTIIEHARFFSKSEFGGGILILEVVDATVDGERRMISAEKWLELFKEPVLYQVKDTAPRIIEPREAPTPSQNIGVKP